MKEQLSLLAKRLGSNRSAIIKNYILFFATIADASVLPLPTSTYFVISASPDRKIVLRSVIVAVAGTVLGATGGYFLGILASDISLMSAYPGASLPWFSDFIFDKVSVLFQKWGIWILLFAAFSPLPYLAFSISSGIIGVNPAMFLMATVAGQSIRFLFLGLLARDLNGFLQTLVSTGTRST